MYIKSLALTPVRRLLEETPEGVFYVGNPSLMSAQMRIVGNNLQPIVDPVIRASVAGDNPINYGGTFVSGTNQMTTISVPSGFRGMICLIPTGAFTGATGGTYASDGVTDTIPIGKAFTAVAAKALYLFTDGLLWYPSY